MDTDEGTGTGERPGTGADVDERLRRWRMVLGGGPADGTGRRLTGRDAAMDQSLEAVYGAAPRGDGGAPPRGAAAWAARRRRSRAGWGTSAGTSPAASCR